MYHKKSTTRVMLLEFKKTVTFSRVRVVWLIDEYLSVIVALIEKSTTGVMLLEFKKTVTFSRV